MRRDGRSTSPPTGLFRPSFLATGYPSHPHALRPVGGRPFPKIAGAELSLQPALAGRGVLCYPKPIALLLPRGPLSPYHIVTIVGAQRQAVADHPGTIAVSLSHSSSSLPRSQLFPKHVLERGCSSGFGRVQLGPLAANAHMRGALRIDPLPQALFSLSLSLSLFLYICFPLSLLLSFVFSLSIYIFLFLFSVTLFR